ncbi:MAG: adenine phosphoribosyltransferase [Clostridiales bacterium]|nr:adenine phosphoribosyltransferase [Clostridiales bacterium]
MDLKPHIRTVPDWPIPGVNFIDITTLLQDAALFKYVVDEMTKPFEYSKIDKVVGIDARGFLLATPIAYSIGCGVSIVRKEGKLPYKTIKESYQKEYGLDVLTMHEDTIKKGEKILIVDDLLATGGTVEATIKMIERLGGEIIGGSFLINLKFLGGSKKLSDYRLKWLVEYDEE